MLHMCIYCYKYSGVNTLGVGRVSGVSGRVWSVRLMC